MKGISLSCALVLHAWQMEQEKHVMELRDEMREGFLRLSETFRHLLEMRQIGQFFPSVGSGQIGIQLVEIRFTNLVANGLNFLLGEHLPFAFHPILHL